jgi:hypothetical protein
MRWMFRMVVHAAIFGGVYYFARRHGLHGEVPYIVAAGATGIVAHFMYRRRRRWWWW